MEKWASRRSKELGIRWGNGALSYFLMRVIPHLEQIETELQKICTYAGANTIISPGEIDDLVAESRGSRVFALSDAMLAKDKEKGLKIIDDLLRQGETPIGLVGLLAHQIRVLGQIKGALEQGVQGSEISKMFGFHPFVVQKTMSPCDHFTWEQLYGALQTLSRADIKLKSTNLSDKLVLEEAILSI